MDVTDNKDWIDFLKTEMETTGAIEDSTFTILASIFGSRFILQSCRLIDSDKVIPLFRTEGQEYQVGDRDSTYLCCLSKPSFCTCRDFYKDVMKRIKEPMCIHMLACLMVCSLNKFKETAEVASPSFSNVSFKPLEIAQALFNASV